MTFGAAISRAAGEQQQRRNADRQADRGQEAEHADRHDQADDDGRQADEPDRDPGPDQRPAEAGVQPLPLAPRGIAHRAVALVEAGEDGIRMIDGAAGLLWDHFCSIGVNGEAAFSSLACATPSARAI